jgi:hypothetical protein
MNLRAKIKELDESIEGDQRAALREKLGEEPWSKYEALQGEAIDDDDEWQLQLVRFVVSLDDPEEFKNALDETQRKIVQDVEEQLRSEMGF